MCLFPKRDNRRRRVEIATVLDYVFSITARNAGTTTRANAIVRKLCILDSGESRRVDDVDIVFETFNAYFPRNREISRKAPG